MTEAEAKLKREAQASGVRPRYFFIFIFKVCRLLAQQNKKRVSANFHPYKNGFRQTSIPRKKTCRQTSGPLCRLNSSSRCRQSSVSPKWLILFSFFNNLDKTISKAWSKRYTAIQFIVPQKPIYFLNTSKSIQSNTY